MNVRQLIKELQRFEAVNPNMEVVVGGIHRGGTLSFATNHVFTEFNMLIAGPAIKISSHKQE